MNSEAQTSFGILQALKVYGPQRSLQGLYRLCSDLELPGAHAAIDILLEADQLLVAPDDWGPGPGAWIYRPDQEEKIYGYHLGYPGYLELGHSRLEMIRHLSDGEWHTTKEIKWWAQIYAGIRAQNVHSSVKRLAKLNVLDLRRSGPRTGRACCITVRLKGPKLIRSAGAVPPVVARPTVVARHTQVDGLSRFVPD